MTRDDAIESSFPGVDWVFTYCGFLFFFSSFFFSASPPLGLVGRDPVPMYVRVASIPPVDPVYPAVTAHWPAVGHRWGVVCCLSTSQVLTGMDGRNVTGGRTDYLPWSMRFARGCFCCWRPWPRARIRLCAGRICHSVVALQKRGTYGRPRGSEWHGV